MAEVALCTSMTSDLSLVVGILGAESTGKSTLARDLCLVLQSKGMTAAVVPEVLREFCVANGRTPMAHEQADLAREQSRRIESARQTHSVVVSDTTALMTAIYSEFIFHDISLYAEALEAHRQVDLTLVTALDLPWVSDGIQRDGEHVREPVDHLIRRALERGGLGHSLVSGQGRDRLLSALRAVDHALLVQRARRAGVPRKPWRWVCEKCDDADCEQHWLPGAT
ncbi:MAG TPA: ATP-binding protein [Aquabacterium sp.]|nr:ATP-binding protein [Aquabacterium sp.]